MVHLDGDLERHACLRLLFLPIQMGRCPRLTRAEGSWATASMVLMTPPSRVTAPPPPMTGEGFVFVAVS
jgi:hypothetical protein